MKEEHNDDHHHHQKTAGPKKIKIKMKED